VDWTLELVLVPVSDIDLSFNDPDGNSWLGQEVRRGGDSSPSRSQGQPV
jgi:hypothetical protein